MSKAISRGKVDSPKGGACARCWYSAPGSAGAKSAPVFRGAWDPAILRAPNGLQRAIVSTPETSDTHFFRAFSIVLGILFAVTILLLGFARVLGKNQNADQAEDPLVKNAAAQHTIAH
jgi:hypothetical protein